jgi:hypothetical protein
MWLDYMYQGYMIETTQQTHEGVGIRDGNRSGSGRVEQLPARQQRGCG